MVATCNVSSFLWLIFHLKLISAVLRRCLKHRIKLMMLLVRKASTLKLVSIGHQHFGPRCSSSKYGSNQVTFDLKPYNPFRGSVISLNGFHTTQTFGLWKRQFPMLSCEFHSQTTSSLLKPAVCAHFEPCKYLHTTSTASSKSKDSHGQDTGGSTLRMSTRIKIVTFLAATWAVIYFAANYHKEKNKAEERDAELKQVDIGASDYELVDQYGKTRTKKDFLGQWFLLYFGFTHCPDICPEELEKMAGIIDIVDSDKTIPNLLPVFVSVDPERDTPEIIGKYVAEFHKHFVGLTGSKDQIKQAAKAFRVYFSAGPRDEDNDYIVDHTIVMYLMNPQGNFVDYYGSRGVPTEKIVESIKLNMKNFKRFHG